MECIMTRDTLCDGTYVRYSLQQLLDNIDDAHFFKQKTRKVYMSYYRGTAGTSAPERKRKSFLADTGVFSDERAIQEIRGALGKMSEDNTDRVLNVLTKNMVSDMSVTQLVQLLHQYATLCIEWNDLYIDIYHTVYHEKHPAIHRAVYDLCENTVWSPKEYEDADQKMFFRTSNVELHAKLGVRYDKYRGVSLNKWVDMTIARMWSLQLVDEENDLLDTHERWAWTSLIMHFMQTVYSAVAKPRRKDLARHVAASAWFAEIDTCATDGRFTVKIEFKWSDFKEKLGVRIPK